MTTKIEMKLVESNFLTRWPCTVCGGVTEKVAILCEGFDDGTEHINTVSSPNPVANLFRGQVRNNIRVCERCLEAGDIDGRLQQRAAELEDIAAWLRSLIGRLKVPTHAEWQAAEEAHELEYVLARTGFKSAAEYDAHVKAEEAAERRRVPEEDLDGPLPF
jgi:hypothetical protein